ncbi:phosphotransferase [Thermus sp.]|uniref:phosphotransferase n=1 Tax=Thermus sp. TaxID=275 RepID=UPI003D125AD4
MPSRSGSLWLFPEHFKRVKGIQRVFAPRSSLLRLAWAACRAGLPVGARVALNSRSLKDLSAGVAPGLRAEGVVVYVGTPGAYRKAVLGLWVSGAPQVVIKLALVPAADPWVAWEARVLERLKDSDDGLAPKVLRTGQYAGRAFHATDPVTGSPGPSRLTRAHFAYSARLFGMEPSRHVWAESPLLREWLADLSHKDLGHAFPTLERSLAWLGERLSHRALSFGWAHRDFVPWNTRWVRGRLLLLDWEMARPCRPPGYDLLHFVSLQAALRGKSARIPWKAFRDWLELYTPEWKGLERELYAAYLLDQALYYAKARLEAPEVGEDRVLNWLLGELRLVVGG